MLRTYRQKVILAFAFLLGLQTAWAVPFVSIADSVAGEGQSFRISGLLSSETATVELARPDGTRIDFPVEADGSGVVSESIYGLHLRQAGEYALEILRDTGTAEASFTVYPAPVSAYRSDITLHQPSIAADGEAEARFTVQLRDAFANPIPNASVQLISSRNDDLITAQKRSDAAGQIIGKIKSSTPGISTLSVVVGETVLFAKPEVVFHLSQTDFANVGSDDGIGSFLKAQLFSEEPMGEVAYFTIENLGEEVTVGKNLTFKVVARDENGDVAQDYLGTVRFSSSDDRANLPKDYRFVPENQGEHTFYLAVTFNTPGTQTLAVHDLNDFRISGEFSTSVVLSGGGAVVPPDDVPAITLLTPRPGTYRSQRMTITGEAVAVDVVELRDGPTILTSDLAVDSAGNFVFQTPALADGRHEFLAIAADDDTIRSNTIPILIDRSGPSNLQVSLEPAGGVDPETPFTVLVTADEPLAGVRSLFQDVFYEHEADGDSFALELVAPTDCGDYPLTVVASDTLGNETELTAAATLMVCGTGTGDGADADSGADQIAPTAPTSVSTTSGEGRITLFWAPAKDNKEIDHYRVEFVEQPLGGGDGAGGDDDSLFGDAAGDDSGDPDSGTDTGDAGPEDAVGDDAPGATDAGAGTRPQYNVTPDDRTQWYVDNLQDDKQYLFRVIAVDADGNEGPASAVVRAVTSGASEMHSAAQKLEESGSTLPFWPTLLAVLAGGGMMLVARRRG